MLREPSAYGEFCHLQQADYRGAKLRHCEGSVWLTDVLMPLTIIPAVVIRP